MRLAFVGTCQMVEVGNVVRQLASQGAIDCEVVFAEQFSSVDDAKAAAFFRTLATVDRTYSQYQDLRFSNWSTAFLGKYFPLRIVPMLWSTVSTPQLGYWSNHLMRPQYIGYVDFRILELFLRDVPCDEAARIYQRVEIPHDRIADAVRLEVDKYRRRFAEGLVAFDYGSFYETEIARDIRGFTVPNHPKRRHLEWLVNRVLEDCGFSTRVELPSEYDSILVNTIAPSFYGEPSSVYMLQKVSYPLEIAMRIFYYYYETFDRAWLEEELRKSAYHVLFRARDDGDALPLSTDELMHEPAARAPENSLHLTLS